MIKTALIIVSDGVARGERQDGVRPVIEEMLSEIDGSIEHYAVLPDEPGRITAELIRIADGRDIDLILTSGGTGLSRRDWTPEATRKAIEREAPGLAEAMRMETMKITPQAMLSRGAAGLRGETLIINLPGSPKAVKECLTIILHQLPHAVKMAHLDGGGHESDNK